MTLKNSLHHYPLLLHITHVPISCKWYNKPTLPLSQNYQRGHCNASKYLNLHFRPPCHEYRMVQLLLVLLFFCCVMLLGRFWCRNRHFIFHLSCSVLAFLCQSDCSLLSREFLTYIGMLSKQELAFGFVSLLSCSCGYLGQGNYVLAKLPGLKRRRATFDVTLHFLAQHLLPGQVILNIRNWLGNWVVWIILFRLTPKANTHSGNVYQNIHVLYAYL